MFDFGFLISRNTEAPKKGMNRQDAKVAKAQRFDRGWEIVDRG
jgi:hypothetical protein